MPDFFYLRRTITQAVGGGALEAAYAVYRVERRPGARQDPVPALGAFPPHWRPLDSSPGVVNFIREADDVLVAPCRVPRGQLRHCTPITEAEARALYPAIGC